MNIDTTIPGSSAEVITADTPVPFGSAGIIAIVGRFEKGDGNVPVFIKSASEGFRKMGSIDQYPGSKAIEMAFKKDRVNDNYGATSAICIKAGASVGASCAFKDSSAATVFSVKLTGGLWGNSVTGTIATGTVSGLKLVLKSGTDVLDTWDNCVDAEDMVKKIRARSNLELTVTEGDLTKTLAAVADSPFSGGTEVAAPTTSDLTLALMEILAERFDILTFTDTPDDLFYSAIGTYLEEKVENDRMCRTTLPIATSKTVAQKNTLMASIDSRYVDWVIQAFTLDNMDALDVAASAVRYAGYNAGLPVYESMTHKPLGDVTDVDKIYKDPDLYSLVDGGATVIELKNRENNVFGVVSAVTGSQTVDEKGEKPYGEQHAIRTLAYVANYMDLTDYLGDTDKQQDPEVIDGELESRKNDLMGDIKVADDISVTTVFDTQNEKLLYENISVKPRGILKWIHKRVKMEV